MLLDYGFGTYKSVPVVDSGAVQAEIFVDKGLPSQVEVVPLKNSLCCCPAVLKSILSSK